MTQELHDGDARLPRFVPSALDESQAALYAEITTGPRAQGPQHFALTDDAGGLLGPFNALLLAPDLGRTLQAVGAAVRYATDLTPRMRETAILTVATRWDSAFERAAHEAVGLAAGLSEDELADVRAGRIPAFEDPVELAAARLAYAMAHGDVDDDEWTRSARLVGPKTVFELSTLVGYYATLALQLRVFRVDPQPD